MSADEKLIWKPETPGSEPAGARISAGIVGQRADVVAEYGRGPRELRAGQLHAVAGVARETDRYPFELLDVDVLLWFGLCGHVAVKPPLAGPSAGAAVAVG